MRAAPQTLIGIRGSLFPNSYLRGPLHDEALAASTPHETQRRVAQRRLQHWWRSFTRACGPATGIRGLFDLGAMPLAAALGYRAANASFTANGARVRLEHAGRKGAHAPAAMIVAPWAHRSPAIWRDAAAAAREHGADWCLVFAPPFLHLVQTRHWSRRALEFTLPDALDDGNSFDRLWLLAHASALTAAVDERPPIGELLARAELFQDGVRAELQQGVASSLDALSRVMPNSGEPLAVIYRMLFLLFAESRDLLPWRHPLYGPVYSITALCQSAQHTSSVIGAWPALAAISRLLRVGCRTPELDVRPFNGHLFSRAAAPTLERRERPAHSARARAEDSAVTHALLKLSTRETKHGREAIAYPDLGVEQLGAVYERVLGHSHRKQSGTFYTPSALTEFVVRRALAPLTRAATADQILALRVVDPAMGSGAFLVAACRYLAEAYERALLAEHRLLDHEIDGDMRAGFRRTIAQRCLFGVDRNPVAVQLARLSLWLATLSGGKPLTFLDHRLRTGDALVGARPQDLQRAPTSRAQMEMPLFDDDFERDAPQLARAMWTLAVERDDDIDAVRRKEAAWSRVNRADSALSRWRLACDLWCARWFHAPNAPSSWPEIRSAIDAILKRDRTLPAGALSRMLQHAQRQRQAQHFFHWPLEFADAFIDADGQPREDAGFDAVIGNPPWEMVRSDHGAENAPAELVRFIRESGFYPSCGRGHLNLYQPFVERALDLARPGGAVGLVLPWGLASDDGAATLRARLLDRCRVSTFVGLDNADQIFPVHRGLRFLMFVAHTNDRTTELPAAGGITTTNQLERLLDSDGNDAFVPAMRISRGALAACGGAERRIPDLRTRDDLALLEELTSRWPSLRDGWRVEFGRELNVTEDRRAFGASGLAVIEGKHVAPFTTDIDAVRFRISTADAHAALRGRAYEHARLAYRDVSAVSNRQSLIAAIVPGNVVTTHTVFCLKTALSPTRQHFLCACFNSYVLNAIVRLLMGGHLTTSLVEQLPVPVWSGTKRQRRIAALGRVLSRRPQRAATIGARLQALVAEEYGVSPDRFVSVLAKFPLIPSAERQLAYSQMT